MSFEPPHEMSRGRFGQSRRVGDQQPGREREDGQDHHDRDHGPRSFMPRRFDLAQEDLAEGREQVKHGQDGGEQGHGRGRDQARP